eukprot:COSAG02_NODE_11282_length_1755_cov_1.242754_2_plen_75_part_00
MRIWLAAGGKDGAFVDYMDALTELNVDMDMYNTQSMAQFNIVIGKLHKLASASSSGTMGDHPRLQAMRLEQRVH